MIPLSRSSWRDVKLCFWFPLPATPLAPPAKD
jgi:hypothetical protein